jgi:antitoxin MazE
MFMQAVIQRWGNSFGIRIPSAIIQKFHFHHGSKVDIDTDDSQISIRPQKYCLDEMLAQITDENRHESMFENEKPRGNEIW